MEATGSGSACVVGYWPTSHAMSPGESAFLSNLPMIEELIRFTARRHRCRGEEADEFASLARLKLIADDYAVLRKFTGRSTLRTYLNTVLRRSFLDYRVQRLGKWRPSARAKRLGRVAERLEVLLNREKRSFDEACQILRVNEGATESESELAGIAARLPARRLRRTESQSVLEEIAVPAEVAEGFAHADDKQRHCERVHGILRDGLDRLTSQERLILRLRFLEGMAPRQITRAVGLKPPSLYRRTGQVLDRLRRHFQSEGLQAAEVSDALQRGSFDLEAAI
jgi:RNA polymerase sigma factor (sigma-70 family)